MQQLTHRAALIVQVKCPLITEFRIALTSLLEARVGFNFGEVKLEDF